MIIRLGCFRSSPLVTAISIKRRASCPFFYRNIVEWIRTGEGGSTASNSKREARVHAERKKIKNELRRRGEGAQPRANPLVKSEPNKMMSKIRILRTIILISALATQLIYSQNLLAKNEPTDPVKLFVQAFQSSFPEGKMANKPELLWKEDQSAFFIATRKNELTQGKKSSRLVAAVFIRQNDNSFKAIDISQVENLNMGKLGLNVRETYDSFALGPVKWIERSDGLYMLEIKTHAWKDGQRYTVSEPVVISAEGKPLWR